MVDVLRTSLSRRGNPCETFYLNMRNHMVLYCVMIGTALVSHFTADFCNLLNSF